MLYPDELQALKPKHAAKHLCGHLCRHLCNRVQVESGRGREIRTPDILLPKQTRYQTALYSENTTGCFFTFDGCATITLLVGIEPNLLFGLKLKIFAGNILKLVPRDGIEPPTFAL